MGAPRLLGPLLLLAAAALPAGSCASSPESGGLPGADLVLLGGTVHTLVPGAPPADAVVIREGRILWVGREAEAAARIRNAGSVVRTDGLHLYPGFVDAHAHMESLGAGLRRLDLVGTRSATEVAARVGERVDRTEPGGWILGRGWDQNDWTVQEFPTRALLDAASPDHPVWLVRIDGHAGWANGRALAEAGVTRETADPPGGRILRDPATGNPTGVLVDAAMAFVSSRVPGPSRAERKDALRRAVAACLSAGLTSVHDAGVDAETVDLYRELVDSGEFPFRVYAMLSDDPDLIGATTFLRGPVIDHGGGRLTVRAVKAYADGALGSRGAALLEEYSDEPGNRGLLQTDGASLRGLADRCLEGGWQLCVHAIGDRGNRVVLDTCEAALAARGPRDARFRIEHAQVVSLADIPRFASLGVIPSFQPTHATSDMPWAEARVGPDRIRGAYAWRTFLRSGSFPAFGSDFPVESHDPLKGMYAAVTRQDADGNPPGGWTPGERVTREEAIRGFTLDACRAAFQEEWKGTLEVGRVADLTVVDTDLFTCPPAEILRARVRMTIVAGSVEFEQ